MKILVTGASGFVGSKFIEYVLNNSNHEIMGIGRKDRYNQDYDYVKQDLLQPFSEKILNYNPDVIVHCAALSSPWGTKEDFYQNNVKVTENMIELAILKNSRFIYISSSSVFYQNIDQFDITENTIKPNQFANEYAETKFMGELVVKEKLNNYTILRPRAVFGPGDTVLFPRIIKVGKIPYIKNKDVIGDLIYIDNLSFYILKSCETKVVGDFNLTNNEPVRIHEFLEEIFKKLSLPYKKISISIPLAMTFAKSLEKIYRFFNIKKEPPITTFGVGVFSYSKTFNVEKTLKQFGEPPYSNEQGITNFINWFKSNGEIK